MKTSAIVQRVVDFLKLHPPFMWLSEEALIAIGSSGRVRYHEQGELLYAEGSACSRRFWVVQKGAIRLFRPSPSGKEITLDLCGVGDIAGAEGMAGIEHFDHQALIDKEAILYQLDLALLQHWCTTSPRASRYMKVLLANDHAPAVAEEGAPAADDPAAHRSSIFDTPLRTTSAGAGSLGSPGTTAAALARALIAGPGIVWICDPPSTLLGSVAQNEIVTAMATGQLTAESTGRSIMNPTVVTVTPDATVGHALLQMVRHGVSALAVTRDGTRHSEVTGTITAAAIIEAGAGPVLTLMQRLAASPDPSSAAAPLAALRLWLQQHCQSPQDAAWIGSLWQSAVHQALQITLGTLPHHQSIAPLLVGGLGRGEAMGNESPQILGLSRAGTTPDEAAQWFSHMQTAVAQLGLGTPPSIEQPVKSLGEWSQLFSELIANPVAHSIWDAISWFDLAPLQPTDDPLVAPLRSLIRQQLVRHPNFVRLLANDAFENLPPITIVEGYAVAADGLQLSTLDLDTHGLQAITSVARVFHIDSGMPDAAHTLERLERAAIRHSEHAAILRAASHAFLILHSFRLRHAPDDGQLQPSVLHRADQVLLKSAFRGVADLLTLTSRHYGV